MWSPWQHYQVTITTLHWRKNNILLNNEHFRTVLGCCDAERPALASRTGAGHELTQLAPSGFVLFFFHQPLNIILPLFGFFCVFFFLYFSLYIEKKVQLFLISQLQKQVHLGTVCIVLTVLQGWSLPPQMHTHTARAQLLSIASLSSAFIFFF